MRTCMTKSIALFALATFMALPLQARQAENDRHGRGPAHGMREAQQQSNPVEKVMGRLKEHDPQEYQRLEKLRKEDWKAFRKKLRNMVRAERRRNFGKGRYPHPKSKQNRRRYSQGGPSADHNQSRERAQETKMLRRQIGKLESQYKKADSEKEKDEIAAEIRKCLAAIYDIRETKWRAIIQGLERKLAKMKDLMREHQAKRKDNIDEKLKEITGNKKNRGD